MPVHHLTGSSSISGQSYRGRGAAGEEPQTVSGFLTGPGSPHPTPRSHTHRFHGSTTSRRLASLRPGATCGPWKGSAASAERSLSPLPQGSGVPPQGRPAEPGGQWLKGQCSTHPARGPFCPLSSPSFQHPNPILLFWLASPHPPPFLFSLGPLSRAPDPDYQKSQALRTHLPFPGSPCQ